MTSFAACLPNYLLHKLYISSLTSTCSRWIPLVSLLQMFLKYVLGPDDGFILKIIRYTQRFTLFPHCRTKLHTGGESAEDKAKTSVELLGKIRQALCALCACTIVSPFHDSPSSLVQKTANARGCKMNQDESR